MGSWNRQRACIIGLRKVPDSKSSKKNMHNHTFLNKKINKKIIPTYLPIFFQTVTEVVIAISTKASNRIYSQSFTNTVKSTEYMYVLNKIERSKLSLFI